MEGGSRGQCAVGMEAQFGKMESLGRRWGQPHGGVHVLRANLAVR